LLVNVETPATVSAPPRVVSPVPTVNVFAPVILVAPFRVTAPVPVVNVPDPVWVMLLLNVDAPSTANVPLIVLFPFIETRPTPFNGVSEIFPVVLPPIVSVLFAVVWIDRGEPASVRFPETVAVPPTDNNPEVTVRFLPDATVVSPLRDIIPVPVVNVPLPEIAKLPADCE